MWAFRRKQVPQQEIAVEEDFDDGRRVGREEFALKSLREQRRLRKRDRGPTDRAE